MGCGHSDDIKSRDRGPPRENFVVSTVEVPAHLQNCCDESMGFKEMIRVDTGFRVYYNCTVCGKERVIFHQINNK
jgi:hypothetical protein